MNLNMTGEGKTVEARELLEAVYIIHRHCKSMMENHENKCCDFCMLGDWKNGCMFSSDEGCAISPEAWDMKQFSKLILRKGKILENEARK